MTYAGRYQGLIMQMGKLLEDTATRSDIPYPAVAILRQWRKVKDDLDSLGVDGFLDDEEVDDAKDYLFQIVDKHLSKFDEDKDEA